MKVLLTGGTGFVGLNTLKSLTEQGHDVHLYVRPSSSREHVSKYNPTIHEGELYERDKINEAMKGMNAVIHTAGNTSCFKRDYGDLYAVNVAGTKNIVDAAIKNNIKRLVYTSTTSTIGSGLSSKHRSEETSPLSGFRAKSPYGKTKLLAEREIMRAHANGIESIILNPGEIIGEYDHNFQWGRLVMAVFANQVPFLPPGSGSFCSAKDVADAHVSALTKGRSGEKYILSGDDRYYTNMLELIEEKLGCEFDRPKVNYKKLYVKEWMKEKAFPLLGKDYLIEPYRIKVFGGNYYYCSSKAQKELNYKVSKLEDMLDLSINWYRANGILPS